MNQRRPRTITGQCLYYWEKNIDTDMIIPASYLTSVAKGGYAKGLFANTKKEQPDFLAHSEMLNDVSFLIAGENFGCGSSREHAVWALQEFGFVAIIAPSFSDIFAQNAQKNGLLLLRLSVETLSRIVNSRREQFECHWDLDIQEQTFGISGGVSKYQIEIDPFMKHCWLNDVDEFQYLLAKRGVIRQFRSARRVS